MTTFRSRIATAALPALMVFGGGGLLAVGVLATAQQQASGQGSSPPAADVQKVLAKYRSFRPDDKDLAIFQLDWVATLNEAKEKAAKEQRPILLIVVTNSYGNMYTGHC